MKDSSIKALAKVAKQRITTGLIEDQSVLPSIAKEKERVWQATLQMHKDGSLVTDPLGRLTQHPFYDDLDETSREKYILDLSKMYLEALSRYERERQ